VAIHFHSQEIPFILREKNKHKRWLKKCIATHGKTPGSLNFIFTSKAFLRRLNREYLHHDYYTDVITFDDTEEEVLSGDVFISVEQVNENALEYGVAAGEELRRVLIHGILHLAGFDDTTLLQREKMREMENEALLLWGKEEQDDPGI
jgi:probable rRNA maturation factor